VNTIIRENSEFHIFIIKELREEIEGNFGILPEDNRVDNL
jgi:hypothetical protein